MPGINAPSLARIRVTAVVTALACALAINSACGGHDPRAANPTGPSPVTLLAAAPQPASVTLIAAGDIARCDTAGAEATAQLLDNLSGTVLALGDNAYMSGNEAEYRNCYEPTWGRHRARTRPVPGNHEYQTAGAAGYFTYFGANAGPAAAGYYSFMSGSWLVLALNSEIPVGAGSAQLEWVREQLTGNHTQCTLAYWHRPLFSSGPNGANRDMTDLWQLLYSLDVDVVINGHEHLYVRFGPQDPVGRADAPRGIRQFIVGTGGSPVSPVRTSAANSEMVVSAWGVGRFTLNRGGYEWEFVPAGGGAFRDTGAGICH